MSATTPELDAMADAAREAVLLAARVTRHVRAGFSAAMQITKPDDSPVTIADYAAQAVVALTLRARLGPCVIVAEESAETLRRPDQAGLLARAVEAARVAIPGLSEGAFLEALDAAAPREPVGVAGEAGAGGAGADGAGADGAGADGAGAWSSGGSFWTLDPIDGTRGFVRGGQYCIALAHVRGSFPDVAALGCPHLGDDAARDFDDPDPRGLLLLARDDGPTRVQPLDDPAARPAPVALAADAGPGLGAGPAGDGGGGVRGPLRLCGSHRASRDSESVTGQALAALEASGVAVARPARLDSQVKYAVVALGRAEAFLRAPRSPGFREKIWDHAAGALVARQAGCVVSDCRGVALDFSRGLDLTANTGLLAARPWAHALLRVELARLLRDGD